MSVGVPIQILQEAEGHTVTVETKSGEIFKGKLVEAEDNMNVQLEACIATFNNGKISNMENIFVRGSKVKLIALPDFLKNAPMYIFIFKTFEFADF
ncbi:Small nuclear ribonucleoprotein Sm D3 [Armadillidium nasatum]|uniref:Small nuclear ribonucleoprotein Sm D3 n=1 Tax=Armadillidium nasatum TaxID=96803 RepID=A0A5N5TBW1_9CRUS|nr:Small nuclear ribonucleoprotein Sm D3 [Armadillidium nasatum]